MMKKSTFGAALAFLAAAAGVLTAVALYLRRREQELDEYEKLLFSDEYDDEDEDDEQDDTASADAEPMADPDADGDISF
ncbi:phosphatase [uncultured Gemmiger sp.]|uniref:phosphatase n=1 Tax=uncultured Gemmiger sp. TaxID=1623490 RepID=UPI0025EA5582|nr:phosphatase [uncultured Gemmiger sp.]